MALLINIRCWITYLRSCRCSTRCIWPCFFRSHFHHCRRTMCISWDLDTESPDKWTHLYMTLEIYKEIHQLKIRIKVWLCSQQLYLIYVSNYLVLIAKADHITRMCPSSRRDLMFSRPSQLLLSNAACRAVSMPETKILDTSRPGLFTVSQSHWRLKAVSHVCVKQTLDVSHVRSFASPQPGTPLSKPVVHTYIAYCLRTLARHLPVALSPRNPATARNRDALILLRSFKGIKYKLWKKCFNLHMNISISVWAVNTPSHTLTDGYKITMYKRWFCNDIRQFRPMASTHVISVEDLCCRRFCFLINAYFANQLCLFWRLAQMMRYMLLLNVCVGLSKSLTYKWTQGLIKKTATISSSNKSFV